MVITYYGKQYIKLSLGDLTIAINPQDKKYKPSRFGADIVLVTTNHEYYNGIETVSLGDKNPFIIDGPGSYEIQGIDIIGVQSTALIGGKEYINTLYEFSLDGINIVCMGALTDETVLSPEAKEIAGRADILFIPIGADETLSAPHAYKMAVSFAPSIIIPLSYEQDTLRRFLKEGGQENAVHQDKLTLKRKDLEGKEGFIMVLDPQ